MKSDFRVFVCDGCDVKMRDGDRLMSDGQRHRGCRTSPKGKWRLEMSGEINDGKNHDHN